MATGKTLHMINKLVLVCLQSLDASDNPTFADFDGGGLKIIKIILYYM